MLKKIALVLLCLALLPSCLAESDFPAYDYLLELGYEPISIAESPGWRTCNLMGGDGWWTLSVSSDTDSRSLMVLPEFDTMFDLSKMQALFVDLVNRFEWDVSFYWPDYDSGAKMQVSYNIVNDIDNTLDNYMDKEKYIAALKKQFGIVENGGSFTEVGMDSEPQIIEDSSSYTNINDQYSEYARNPDVHKYELIEFSGEVIQVIEGEDFSQYRVAVKGDSDMVFFVDYTRPEGEARILEDDMVTVRGVSGGVITYESTMGGQITVPSCYAIEIAQYVPEAAASNANESVDEEDMFDVTGYMYTTRYDNYLLLDITNNSGIDAALDISVRYFGENGNLVGVSNLNERAVADGTRILSVATNDLAFTSYEYEITPQKESIYRCVNNAFEVEQTIAPGKVILAVTNTSPYTAEFVRCDAIFMKDGNVVDHDFAYAMDSDDDIKPGKTQYEEIKSKEEFDDVLIFVHGKADK